MYNNNNTDTRAHRYIMCIITLDVSPPTVSSSPRTESARAPPLAGQKTSPSRRISISPREPLRPTYRCCCSCAHPPRNTSDCSVWSGLGHRLFVTVRTTSRLAPQACARFVLTDIVILLSSSWCLGDCSDVTRPPQCCCWSGPPIPFPLLRRTIPLPTTRTIRPSPRAPEPPRPPPNPPSRPPPPLSGRTSCTSWPIWRSPGWWRTTVTRRTIRSSVTSCPTCRPRTCACTLADCCPATKPWSPCCWTVTLSSPASRTTRSWCSTRSPPTSSAIPCLCSTWTWAWRCGSAKTPKEYTQVSM